MGIPGLARASRQHTCRSSSMLGSAVSSSTPRDFQPSSHMGVVACPVMNRHAAPGPLMAYTAALPPVILGRSLAGPSLPLRSHRPRLTGRIRTQDVLRARPARRKITHRRARCVPGGAVSDGASRVVAGLSRAELARRAATSRPTLAAYAAGTKNPTLATAERIARAAGFDLALAPHPTFREVPVANGRAAYVPTVLSRLPLERAFNRVRLPLHLNWSQSDREFDLANRQQRARVYEIVMREGTAEDIARYRAVSQG